MIKPINIKEEFNSNFDFSNNNDASQDLPPEFKQDEFYWSGQPNISPEKLLGKAHLTDKQIIGRILLIATVFFGILAVVSPYGSVVYGIYSAISLGASGILSASDHFKKSTAEIPIKEEWIF